MLLLFTNYVSPRVRYILGFVLIFIVFIFVVYNIIIMLLMSCKLFIFIIRRTYARRQRKALRGEVKKVTRGLKSNVEKPGIDHKWFKPDKLNKKYRTFAESFSDDEGQDGHKDAKHMTKLKVMT